MTPEEKSLLERTHKLAEENNEILRKMRRSSVWSLVFRATYWVVIVVLGFGAYYFIEPYVDLMLGVVQQASDVVDNANDSIGQVQNSLSGLLK